MTLWSWPITLCMVGEISVINEELWLRETHFGVRELFAQCCSRFWTSPECGNFLQIAWVTLQQKISIELKWNPGWNPRGWSKQVKRDFSHSATCKHREKCQKKASTWSSEAHRNRKLIAYCVDASNYSATLLYIKHCKVFFSLFEKKAISGWGKKPIKLCHSGNLILALFYLASKYSFERFKWVCTVNCSLINS